MLGVDIQGSSAHQRDESLSSELVDTLEGMLTAAFRDGGIGEAAYSYQNRGDGGRFDFSEVSPVQVIGVVMDTVPARLRSHNKRVGSNAQLSVRFAMHHGYVVPRTTNSDHNGRAVDYLHGILDSTEVRSALHGRDWVLALSEAVWRDIVEPGHGDLDDAAFAEQRAHIKRQGEIRIWMTSGTLHRSFSSSAPDNPAAGTDPPGGPVRQAPEPARGIVFGGATTIIGSNVSGGDQNISGRDG